MLNENCPLNGTLGVVILVGYAVASMAFLLGLAIFMF